MTITTPPDGQLEQRAPATKRRSPSCTFATSPPPCGWRARTGGSAIPINGAFERCSAPQAAARARPTRSGRTCSSPSGGTPPRRRASPRRSPSTTSPSRSPRRPTRPAGAGRPGAHHRGVRVAARPVAGGALAHRGRGAARELAGVLGVSANAAAAMAYRAREKLRQAYLRPTSSPRRRPATSRTGPSSAPTCGAACRRVTRKVDEHLQGCESCRALAAELEDVNRSLRAVPPLFLLVGGGKLGGAVRSVGRPSAPPPTWAGRRAWWARSRIAGPAVGNAAAIVVVVAGVIGMGLDRRPPGPGPLNSAADAADLGLSDEGGTARPPIGRRRFAVRRRGLRPQPLRRPVDRRLRRRVRRRLRLPGHGCRAASRHRP